MAQKQYLDQHGLETLWSNIKQKKAHYLPTHQQTVRVTSTSAATQADSGKQYNVIQDVWFGKDSNGHIVAMSADMLTINEYDIATPSQEGVGGQKGLLSASDKEKLDQLSGGGAYAPNRLANGSTSGSVYTTSSVSSASGYVPVPIINGIPYYQDKHTTKDGHYLPDGANDDRAHTVSAITRSMELSESGFTVVNNLTISADTKGHILDVYGDVLKITLATQSTSGLMSAADKEKLNGISNGATKGTDLANHYTPIPSYWMNLRHPNSECNDSPEDFSALTAVDICYDAKGHFVSGSAETVHVGLATSLKNGLMSYTDYQKLDNIQPGSERNIINSVTIGNTEIGPTSSSNRTADITSALDDYFAQKITTAIVPKGTKQTVPPVSAETIGNMYNISAAFTITSEFVEYESGKTKTYPAGTNIYVVNTGTQEAPIKKWDVLAGFVDLSNYVTDGDLVPITDAFINALS